MVLGIFLKFREHKPDLRYFFEKAVSYLLTIASPEEAPYER